MTASRDTTSRDTTSRETTSNAAEELESLLEFVYMFPVGLIEFRYSGQIARLNPEAVRLLAPVLAAVEFENVFVCFGSLWPELRDAVRALSQPGSRLDAHRVKVSASGVTTWLSLTLARVANGSTMLTISDVTREVAVEQDVRDSEERLRALFDSIDEGYCVAEMIVDDEGNAVDYRFLEVNPLFEEMTGLRGALGRTALELVPDLEPVWVQTYARTALGRETQRFEQGSDVMGRWFEVFCTPVAPTGRFAIVFKDQTGRRRWERALQESESRFRTMADSLPLMVWQFDSHGGERWFNKTFRLFLGVDNAVSVEAVLARVAEPADSPKLEELRRAVVERVPFHAVTKVRRADGEIRWLESWAQPQLGDNGEHCGYLGTSADVSDRVAAEETLRSASALNAFRAHLAETLQTHNDAEQMLGEALKALGGYLGASRVYYMDMDQTGEYATVRADYCRDLPSFVGRYRLEDFGDLPSEFHAGRSVVVNDVAIDTRLNEAQRAKTLPVTASYVLDPIVDGGRAVAALAVQYETAHNWTPDELAVVNATLHGTRNVLERSRLEEKARVRHARAEFAADLLTELEAQPTPEACHERLVDALIPGLADYATVEVPDSDQFLLAAAHRDGQGLETLRTLRLRHRIDADCANSSRRAADGEAQLLSVVTPAVRAEYATTPEVAELSARLGLRSRMSVPLDLGAGTKGVLMVGLVENNRPAYDDEDLGFLTDLARRVGIVLAASRLRHAEHTAAVRLQQALLPDAVIWHPDIVIEARYHAASDLLEVGGDWYDTFVWPCGRIGLMVGDVVGHDLESAAAMGRLRAATAALASHLGPDPAVLLDALDRFARSVDGTSFATAVCVIVDPATGLLTYSSAGHPPVLVIDPDATVTRLDGAQSPPLCAITTSARRNASITLETGSLVVMYSDGLIERRRERLDNGIDRLQRSAIRNLDDRIEECTDQIVADMTTHSAPADDVVVACFRYTPASARFETRLPAQGEQLAVLRAAIRVWADDQHVAGKPLNDLLLGVGEAVSNAIDHAYRDTHDGVVAIDITNHRAHLVARVADNGHWRQAGSHSLDRGRGTSIMKAVASHYERETNSNGTTVVMSFPQAILARTHQP